MAKNAVKLIFFLYQTIFYSPNRTCRFEPTCSLYALTAIEKYGVIKGMYMTIKRVSSCHPFSKRPYYDPV